MERFHVLTVTSEMRSDAEQIGSKPKFWFKREEEDWLFKEARETAGEDWSEKVASEIAKLMGLPTHQAELAIWNGKRGCAVKSFLPSKQFVLVHGNELMGGVVAGYDKEKQWGQSDHTFDNIRKARGGIFRDAASRHGLSPMAVAQMLAERHPQFFRPWQKRVAELPPEQLHDLLERIPSDRISPAARSFALAFLALNRKLLIDLL